MTDQMVLKTQQWLNRTYRGRIYRLGHYQRANPRSANRAGYYDNGEQFRTGNYQSLPVSVA